MDECSECGKRTFTWSTYSDYCTNPECRYEFVYPSVQNARPGTLTEQDRNAAARAGMTAGEQSG